MLATQGLAREFGGRMAVENLTFSLEEGRLLALLGPNGAGKTTTIRLLLGLIAPTAGTATVAGVRVPGPPAEMATLRGRVGLLTETPGCYDRLSARDNLRLFGRLYGLRSDLDDRIERYLRQFDLWDRRDDLVATYSKGMKQRLAIIRTVFHDPQVVFFDEPTSGLDPESARAVRRLIVSLKAAGRTIVVCTHNLGEAAELADVVGVLRGRLLAYGPPATLGSDVRPRVRISVLDRAAEAAALLAGLGASCETTGESLTVLVDDPRTDTPPLLRGLIEGGFDVVAAEPVSRSLEELYLRAVGSDA